MRHDFDIGYERILGTFKQAQSECPKGVGLKATKSKSGQYILLQFRLGDKRVAWGCDCTMTLEGISNALKKAHLVAEGLRSHNSEVAFKTWYEAIVTPPKNAIVNDETTFSLAIEKVESKFWNSLTRKKLPRNKSNPSHQRSWYEVYGSFYKLLPPDKIVNFPDMKRVLDTKKPGSTSLGYCLYAFKKLAETIGHESLLEQLNAIDFSQTEFRELQNAELESFLEWRKKTIENAGKRYLQNRQQWLWVASMCLVYGFRVHEVFAIKNLSNSFKTKDGVIIPALNSLANTHMIAVVGEETALNTTTKTGYRLAAPMLPPSHPELIESLDIRSVQIPIVNLKTTNSGTIGTYYASLLAQRMKDWNCPFTQTHALRHLANLNAKQAGINIEDRAKNLGHSIAMNEQVYTKREATSTRIAAIEAMNKRQLPLEGAIAVLKRIGSYEPLNAQTITVVSEIYGVGVQDILDKLK